MRSSLLLLAPLAAATLATPAAATTFDELLTWCAPAGKGSDPTLCKGYLESELELLASPDPVSNGGTPACVPADYDRGRIVGLMREYARHHPESRGLSSPDGLGLALKGRFPCRWLATPRAAATTFGKLLAWCGPADQGGDRNSCRGHLDGGLGLLASADPTYNRGTRVCVPADEDRGRIIGLLLDYADHDPSSRGLPSTEGLGLALKGRFPCR
jgi:Rap1a immunity proteins